MIRKKILLIYPALNKNTTEVNYHWFPYSVLPLAQSLEKAGFSPIIIDLRVEENANEIIDANIDETLFVGISSMSGYQILSGLSAAQYIRQKKPEVPIIWGGWHPTILPEETAKHPLVNIVIAGRGEKVIVDVAKAIENKTSLSKILGVAINNENETFFNGRIERSIIEDDAIQYDKFISIDKYINPDTMMLGYFSGHGCIHKCGFCSRGFLVEKPLLYSPEKVIEDIIYYYNKYKFRRIHFHDDTLFINKSRIFEIAQLILEHKLQITWWGNMRSDTLWRLSEREILILKSSGFDSAFIGVESANKEMLILVNKKIQPDDIVKSSVIAKKYDIKLTLSYILGLPGDNVEILKENLNQIVYLKEINEDIRVQICFYQPYPCTPLYEKAIDMGYTKIEGLENWGHLEDQSTKRTAMPWLSKEENETYQRVYSKLLVMIK